MKRTFLLLGIAALLATLLFPGSALGWMPYYGYGTPWVGSGPGSGPGYGSQSHSRTFSVRLEQGADQANYYIAVHLDGIAPEAVNVNTRGRWLNISVEDTTQASSENPGNEQGGYFRSFSYSSNHMNRTISLPRDANPDAMRRENLPGRVNLLIPRFR